MQIVAGGTPPSKEASNFTTGDLGIPWITPADLSGYKQVYISHGARSLTEKGFVKSSAKKMPAGSVLFSSRAPIGYVAIAANEISTNQGFKSFVLPDGINNHFIYYYLKYIKPIAEEMATGTTFKELSGAAAAKIPVIVAPSNEQKRIADKLDAVLARVDACRDRLDRIPTILKRFRQSVLAAATSGKLTEDWRAFHDADSWQQTQLRELAILITKGASPNWQGISYVDAGAGATLFVTSQNVRDMRMDVSEPKYVDSAFNQGQRRSVLRRGDLLTNIVGASIGRSTIYDSDELANINQAVCLIRLKEDVERKFMLYVLSAPAALAYMNIEKVDVARANLSLVDIGNVPVELPTRAEQTEIVRRVEALFAMADRLESHYATARAQVDKLTPATLAKAFRGELVPQDPNDEPASALLERIKSSRADGATKPLSKRTSKKPKPEKVTKVALISLANAKDYTMKKQSLTKLEDIAPNHLANILNTIKQQDAKDLWSSSGLSIDDFYVQLNREIRAGLLRVSKDDESHLELVSVGKYKG
jgi:type I restriction enzyme S subunit